MGKPYLQAISDEQKKTILAQKLFFVGSAGPEGTVNVSPRGHECFRILNDNQVAWIDYPGSGNETALHLKELNRITIMFCDLVGTAQIVRLFGTGRSVLPEDTEFQSLLEEMGFEFDPVIRQIFVVDVQLTSNSCGSGVPVFEYKEEGTLVEKWQKREKAGQFKEVFEKVASLPRPKDVLGDPSYFS